MRRHARAFAVAHFFSFGTAMPLHIIQQHVVPRIRRNQLNDDDVQAAQGGWAIRPAYAVVQSCLNGKSMVGNMPD